MSIPVDNLLRLQVIAEQSGDTELSAWLADGLDAYLFAEVPLEQALFLASDGPGKRPARRLYLLNKRNAAIRAAWCICDGDSPWRRSLKLAAAVRRFQDGIWPKWRTLDSPPDNASELYTHLFTAHRCGGVPRDARQCHRIAVSVSGDAD